MLADKCILAIVPARSGSKGIPNKNMRLLDGVSLIGRAGLTLGRVPFLDARVISTDSPTYASEGQRYGLEAPFLRPPALSTDEAGAVETIQHALLESEKHYAMRFDIVLIIEPTSPLRIPEDVIRTTERLVDGGADSVVTVSPVSTKFHPMKTLTILGNRIGFYTEEGARVQARQELKGEYYWRNGICYALTRGCLMDQGRIFTDNTEAEVIIRPIVNIDELIELVWAEFLLKRAPDACTGRGDWIGHASS